MLDEVVLHKRIRSDDEKPVSSCAAWSQRKSNSTNTQHNNQPNNLAQVLYWNSFSSSSRSNFLPYSATQDKHCMEEELDHQGVDSCKPQSLPPGWETVLDPTHHCWFFVSPDGNTQWEHPEDVVFVFSPWSVPAGWQSHFDPTTCCWYFLSPGRHTQWEHPEDGKIYKQHEETTGASVRPIEGELSCMHTLIINYSEWSHDVQPLEQVDLDGVTFHLQSVIFQSGHQKAGNYCTIARHTLLDEVDGRFTMTASEEMSGTGDLDIPGLVSFISRGLSRTAEPSASCWSQSSSASSRTF